MNVVHSLVLALLALQARPPTQLIPYYVSDGNGVAGYESGDSELAVYALDAWSRESGGRVKFAPVKAQAEALLLVRWVAAGEGQFGETQRILVRGEPGAVVFVSPVVSSMGEPFASRARRDPLFRDTIVYLTCVHEIGHALGLKHTANFQDIMYYFGYGGDLVSYFLRYRDKLHSRADITKFSGLSQNDIAVLKSLH